MATAMEGVEPTTIQNELSQGPKQLHLSDTERQILELWDQLQEMQLEMSILKAQQKPELQALPATTPSDADILAAQRDLLESKSLSTLHLKTIQSTLIAPSIIRSIHSGPLASPTEQSLLPLLTHRDNLSLALTRTSTSLTQTLNDLTNVSAQNILVAQTNAMLAKEMLGLANRMSERKKLGEGADPRLRRQVEEREEEMRVARQRWRIMKGTIQGVVTGSGVDWARDRTLRGLVMEEDSDDDE